MGYPGCVKVPAIREDTRSGRVSPGHGAPAGRRRGRTFADPSATLEARPRVRPPAAGDDPLGRPPPRATGYFSATTYAIQAGSGSPVSVS